MRAGLRGSWALLLLGLSLTACGGERSLPAACSRGPDAVRAALRSAPGAVKVEGTRLSTCVARASDAGELEAVGGSLVGAAAELSRSARLHPGGAAELQLGYLVGAARRGAGRERGARSELLRRLEQEGGALRGDRDAYRHGLRAGGRSG
jgi:hypothetical protein